MLAQEHITPTYIHTFEVSLLTHLFVTVGKIGHLHTANARVATRTSEAMSYSVYSSDDPCGHHVTGCGLHETGCVHHATCHACLYYTDYEQIDTSCKKDAVESP